MRRSVVPNRVAALSIAILLALIALTISGGIATIASGTETRSLTSTADTQIVENAPTKNYGAATSLGVNENDQSSIGKDKFVLVKWDLSGIAPGTQISSASVTLNVTTTSPQSYQAYVLKQPWVESAATWNVFSSGMPWEVAGAKGALDKEATVAGSITPSVKGKNTLTLPVAVVQGWVDDPSTNRGIIIANPSSTRGFNFSSREDTDPTRRPQLTLDLPPDTNPPETTIDSEPSGMTSSGDANFTFSSSEADSTLECSLDSATYTACTSPKGYTNLSDGSHTFSVKATDAAGNTDTSPASTTWTVDTTAPETTIDSGPSGTITIAEATFEFSSEEGAAFECRLDGAAYSACTSPKSYTALTDGSHTFQVKATDAVGNTDTSPESWSWRSDATPPTISTVEPADEATGVGATSNVEAAFSEAMNSSTIDGSTFILGKQDSTAPVAAQVTYDPVSKRAMLDPEADLEADATYTATLKSGVGGVKDDAGNPLAEDEAWSFTTTAASPPADTTPPETTIDSGPSGTVSTGSTSFVFSSSEEVGSTFECSLDGSAFEPCPSPKEYTDLSEGSHTFSVKATDAAGNTDASPASTTWTIDTTAPDTKIDSNPNALTNSASASFDFSSTEPGSSFQCKFDSTAYKSCTSPNSLTGLSDGSHTFSVEATDAASNTDATPADFTWTVDTTPPDTSITDGPAEGSTDTDGNVTFTFSGIDNKAIASYEVKNVKDGVGEPFVSNGLSTTKSFTNLANGTYSFRVRAIDTSGNISIAAVRNYSIQVPQAVNRISVRDYGATTGDSSDDSAAFERAMAATGDGEVTYVPAGTFNLDSVDIPSDTDVEVEAAATLKKFGTAQGYILDMKGPNDTTWAENIHLRGVNGDFMIDINDAGQQTGCIRLMNVRHFSIEHMVCRQNNDNHLQEAPSSRRPGLQFIATQTAPVNGTYMHPTDGLISDVHSIESPYGWGLVQTTGGEDLTFNNISGDGGTVLRLENFSAGWTPMRNIDANGVTCTNGHTAVQFNPHGATHRGDFYINNVTAKSCESGAVVAGDGSYGPNAVVDHLTVIPGSTAQVRDPAKDQTYVGAWLVTNSKWCQDIRSTSYTVSFPNLECGGLPSR
jgi:hypothetical protein